MQNWRFDDLTRTLGTATSRRQVFKGLIGGLVAAAAVRTSNQPTAAAPGCSVRKCKEEALKETFLYQSTNCKSICQDPKLFVGCIGCQITANRLHRQWVKDCESGDGCLSVTGEVCCGSACVDLTRDSSNCGTCGHSCAPGETCQGGQCTCGDQGLICNGQCIDPQANAKHCGSCDHACGTCQTCDGGQCVDVECGDGELCCGDQCIDVTSDHDNCGGCGVVCASNQTCLHRSCQCVPKTCLPGKTFNQETCECECSNTCPSGETQNPVTCACQDLCKNVSCGECETCDPTTGHCVEADDETPCGTNQVCCSGTCKDSCNQCSGQPDGAGCGNGNVCCGGVCQPTCGSNPCGPQMEVCTADIGFYCCETDATCCPGNFPHHCGPDPDQNGVCCGLGTVQCGATCCAKATDQCTSFTLGTGQVCCPTDSSGADSSGNCCGPDQQPIGCPGDGPVTYSVCCDNSVIQAGGWCC